MLNVIRYQLLALLAALLVATVVRASEPSKTLAALESFPVWEGDRSEPAEARKARLSDMADAIDSATKSREERALLIMKAWHESRFARYVQLDEPRCRDGVDGRCDHGESLGPWQQKGTARNISLEEQASRALKLLRDHMARCKSRGAEPVAGAIALYATGHSCSWSGAGERVATWRRIVGRL